MTNDETIESIKALPDGVAIEMSDEYGIGFLPTKLTTDDLKALVARLERAEAVLRVYADGKNWKSPKGSMALILWRPNQDFASTNLGYALARKALEDKQND